MTHLAGLISLFLIAAAFLTSVEGPQGGSSTMYLTASD